MNTQYTGAGGGILSLMANGATAPVTNIFYFGYAPVTTAIPFNGPGSGGLFDAQISSVGGADLIIDVVGYYAAPVATALQCAVVSGVAQSVGANLYQYMGLTSCASGYTAVSAGFSASANVEMADDYEFNPSSRYMYVKNVGATATTVTPTVTCCAVDSQ